MQMITDNERFMSDYRQLANVSLNPERHTAGNALAHCNLVVEKAKQLAKLNLLNQEETQTLVNLSYVHDIGKIHGNAKPEQSVQLLSHYGEFSPEFVALVKYHDINLPWYISHTRGETPSPKAWRKLSNAVDLKILSIFMVADRVDCPGGWKKNKALLWFLGNIQEQFSLHFLWI